MLVLYIFRKSLGDRIREESADFKTLGSLGRREMTFSTYKVSVFIMVIKFLFLVFLFTYFDFRKKMLKH